MAKIPPQFVTAAKKNADKKLAKIKKAKPKGK